MGIPRHAYLNDLAAKRIGELEADGIEVLPEDVAMLNAICWDMRGVGCESGGLSRGRCVSVGGVKLWPYTIQTIYAIDEIDIDDMSNEDQAYTLAYIMAHAREHGAFDGGIDQADVMAWAKKLACTVDELTEAIQEITRQSSEYENGFDPKQKDETDTASFVGSCQRLFGGTAEYWEMEVSASYAMRLMIDHATEQSGQKSSPKSVLLTRAMLHYIDKMKSRQNDGED